MECIIPSQNVKVLVRGIHSLARIGEHLYIDPSKDGLFFRTMNMAESAYSSIFFNISFFSKYKYESDDEDTGKCKITMKACLTIFKTPQCLDRNVDTCRIFIDTQSVKLLFEIHFSIGYTKNYLLHVCENETLALKYNKDKMCNKVCILSKQICNAIRHFGKSDEITFDVTLDKFNLRNYFGHPSVDNKNIVRTSLSLQRNEFDMYNVSEPCTITFTLKELKALCKFSESSNSLVGIYFEKPGKPIIFDIQNGFQFEANYVISTLPPNLVSSVRPRTSQLSDMVSSVTSTSGVNTSRANQKKRKLLNTNEEHISPTELTGSVRRTQPEEQPGSVGRIQSQEQTGSVRGTHPEEQMSSVRRTQPSRNAVPVEAMEVDVSTGTSAQHLVQQILVEAEVYDEPSCSRVENTVDNMDDEDELMLKIDLNTDHFQPTSQINGDENAEETEERETEMSETQRRRIDNVFKYCFDYSPRKVPPLEGEVLCEDSDG